jgi:hypothetical protein
MKYQFKEGKSAQDYIEVQYLSDKPLTVQERDCLAVKDYTALVQVVERLYDGVTFEKIMSLFDKIDPFQKKWEEINENFDWQRVEKVMNFLNWRWYSTDGVPNVRDLKHKAYNLLKEAYDNGGFYAIGGFEAEYLRNDDFLKLSFVLDSWDC